MRNILMTGLAATVGLLLLGATSAQAADIIAEPGGTYVFAPGPYVQAQGESSNFLNQDDVTAYHNVTSAGRGPDGQPLFVAETIAGGTNAPVAGTQYLTAGSYPFVCTLHPGMNGNLEVTGSGTPVPRPGVKLAVLKQKLKQVRKTGKLRIKVTPLAPSTGVSIEVTKGNKAIGSATGVNVTGSAKTIAVKLTKAGRKAIKKGKKVKFAVSAKVPSGKPAKSSRVLR
jgi:plastocyanin